MHLRWCPRDLNQGRTMEGAATHLQKDVNYLEERWLSTYFKWSSTHCNTCAHKKKQENFNAVERR